MSDRFFPLEKTNILPEEDDESFQKETNSNIPRIVPVIGVQKGFSKIKIVFCLAILILLGIIATESLKSPRIVKEQKTQKILEPSLTEAQCIQLRLYYEQLVDSIKVYNISTAPERIEDWNVRNFVTQNFQYENRFSPYANINKTYSRYAECNKNLIIEDRSAVYIQIRDGRQMTPDLLTSLRALFIETGWKMKIDAYLVVHVDSIEGFKKDNFPEELHPILLPVTEKNVSNDFIDRIKGRYIWTLMKDANYLTDIWISNKFPQYNYIWTLEDDVRSIAPWSYLMEDTINSCNKQTAESHLILFAPIFHIGNKSTYWKTDLIPQEHSYKAFTNLRRLSRTFIKSLENATLNHQFANLEHFIPSMASQYDLDVCVYVQPTFYKDTDDEVYTPHLEHKRFHYVNLPPLEKNNTYPTLGCFHCCHADTIDLWHQWQNKTIEYLPMMVMHPVKVNT